MTSDNVRIRVRVGANEVEIEAPRASVKEAISFIPEIVQQLPEEVQPGWKPAVASEQEVSPVSVSEAQRSISTNIPEIKVEKDDSLSDVVIKLFRDPWGRQPKRLGDVREVLESYGLIYPKQSVAVALLRLAQSGRLRRFKGEEGDFVYTGSTSLFAYTAPEHGKEKVNSQESQTSDTSKGEVAV